MNAREHLAHLTAYDELFQAVFPNFDLTGRTPLSPPPARHDLEGGGADGIGSPPHTRPEVADAGSPPSRHLRLVKGDGAA